MKGFGATIKRYWWLFAALLAFLLFLSWLWDTNGPDFALALLGMIIAAGALLVALSSLELARATTRPFLTYLVDKLIFDKNNKVSLRIVVSNTGNLPAEKPLFQLCQVTLRNITGESSIDTDKLRKLIPEPDELKKRLKDERKETTAVYFPGEKRNFTFVFGPNMLREYQKSKCLAMGIIIFYKSMQREYETVRWFLHDKRKPPRFQFAPIPEKDYFK